MKRFYIKTQHKQLLADMLTPVGIYLKLRDKFVNTILLESSDYHGSDNSFSYICCEPVASFELNNEQVTQRFPDGTTEQFRLPQRKAAVQALQAFAGCFEAGEKDIDIQAQNPETAIPQVFYQVFRYVIAINHFKDELYIFEHQYQPDPTLPAGQSGLDQLEILIRNRNVPTYSFRAEAHESSNVSDDQMRGIIQQCINHCLRGDVFQIVPSRRFSKKFQGDEFNVYRALRSINPSPYLFYFDYGSYKIFGSSPEKQILIKQGQAEIHPIAGTFKRSGDDAKDAELARQLLDDPKESAEHVMLVDLARNDLSRSSDVVRVETFKEVQFYSHVIHLVSKVTGRMTAGTNPLQLVADTFPAGTLSGAPKHNAMTLINRYEVTNRSIYGGAIGFMDFNGDFNHAIAIRTFLSKNNTLFFQAGMGVVAKSDIESEMAEVGNKLAALRKATQMAETL